MDTRYVDEVVTLTEAERAQMRLERINRAKEVFDDAVQDLAEAVKFDPPVTEQRRVAVEPGDPRYDSATFDIEDALRADAERISVAIYNETLGKSHFFFHPPLKTEGGD